jgi:ATP-dependent exoDNAse (exonuclease V) beta subunit
MIERTENHEYKDGDIIYPGVTNVLQDVGIIQNSRFATPGRGKRMHKLVEYFLTERLDFSDINQEEQELIEWIVKIIQNNNLQVIEVEKIVYNSVYHYAGTLDYLFKKDGQYYVSDLKTGHKSYKWYKVQLAAYTNAIDDISNVHGILLYERTKHIEIIKDYELNTKYFPVFKSALNVYNFKRS